jgi:hypothetical protein
MEGVRVLMSLKLCLGFFDVAAHASVFDIVLPTEQQAVVLVRSRRNRNYELCKHMQIHIRPKGLA